MNQYVIREYLTPAGRSPFNDWLTNLGDIRTTARIRTRLDRVSLGHLGGRCSLGGGVFELRFHFGSGYRVYYGRPAEAVVLSLCGGDKSTQRKDINRARELWADFRGRTSG